MNIDKNDSYWANIERATQFEYDYMLDKAGKPVDKDEWGMTPQTVNAYYNPTTNEICFPAGILQYPFFDMNADDAFNYGAIGVVIGHEMTHGFDDQGRQFDKDGNLKDWWTAEDAERFNKRAQVMVNFFDSIEVLPGLYANGSLTLGENIADHLRQLQKINRSELWMALLLNNASSLLMQMYGREISVTSKSVFIQKVIPTL